MQELSKQRNDLSNSLEDFERVMEDYFQIIPPDIDFFKIDKSLGWEYCDLKNIVTFYFEDDWYLDEFLDEVLECPKYLKSFYLDPIDGVDREKLTIILEGKIGGLIG